ncbi:MAG: glycosyltransferase family 4 protein [Dehalococcoidia bacterium]
MSKTLLIVSADAAADAAQAERGEAPRRDYHELARLLDADLLDFGAISRGTAGSRLARPLGGAVAQALFGWRRSGAYQAVYSDGEHFGLLLGILFRFRRHRPRHVLLAHHLTPKKKHLFARLARPAIDALIVHAALQRRLAIEQLGFAPARVHHLPYQADQNFWRPQGLAMADPPLICSAGLECRDYETVIDAIEGLPVGFHIGAASHWSSKRNLLQGRALTAQVQVDSYDYVALRDLYARSRFVVVPLFDVDFQAGITLMLEAMAMARAIVVTRTQAQRDVVVGPVWQAGATGWPAEGPPPEESSGIYVAPGDVDGWRSAIGFLLAHPEVCQKLGANGRRAVEERFTVEQFAQRLAALIQPADS